MAQRQRYLRYDILKNKTVDVKKLIPKILEGFIIVITWPLQMRGLKGSHYATGQAEISKKLAPWDWTFTIEKLFAFLIQSIIQK